MKILDLPLKAKWYNMIESGEKQEEYRRIKSYWCKRLLKCEDKLIDGITIRTDYTHVRFRYGYTKRTMLFELHEIDIDYGNPEWGAPENEMVFILKLGNRI